jgi:hypothetical protein
LVFLFAAVGLALARHGGPSGLLRSPEYLVTVVLGMLAVLPIRQVTVPSDVRGLTRIDLILGFEMSLAAALLLAALAWVLVRRAIPTRSGHRPPTGSDSPP